MINSDNVENVWEFTRVLTEECFPRLTGEAGCLSSTLLILDKLKYCDNIDVQKFNHRPKGFLKFLPVSSVIHFIALILFIIDIKIISVLLFSLNAFIFISQLLFYWGLFDFPFKKDEGINVIGTIEPVNEVKQQIIFSGHYDAPYVFQLLEKYPKYYALIFSTSLASVLLSLGFWIFLIFPWNPIYYTIFISILSISVISFLFFTTNEISPGAGDNAIAVGLIIELGKLVVKRLNHTRVIILALDAEESGLNGSRAYVNKYKNDLKSIPTYNFNIDSIYEKRFIRVFTRDLNSIRKLSETEAKIIQNISKNLGFEIPISSMPLGGGSTDSAEFSRVGVESIALVGLSLKPDENTSYHTSRDNMSVIDRKSIDLILRIMEEYCLSKDK